MKHLLLSTVLLGIVAVSSNAGQPVLSVFAALGLAVTVNVWVGDMTARNAEQAEIMARFQTWCVEAE